MIAETFPYAPSTQRVTWHCADTGYTAWAYWDDHEGEYALYVEHEDLGYFPSLAAAREAVQTEFRNLIAAKGAAEETES